MELQTDLNSGQTCGNREMESTCPTLKPIDGLDGRQGVYRNKKSPVGLFVLQFIINTDNQFG